MFPIHKEYRPRISLKKLKIINFCSKISKVSKYSCKQTVKGFYND